MSFADATLVAALLVLVAALFVLAMIEVSLLHLRRSAVATRAAKGERDAQRLIALLDDLPRVMNTVLLTVLLSQVTATAVAGVLAQRWFGGTGITIATIAVTMVLFIYGEAIPKTIAIAHPFRHARRFSRLARGLTVVLGPIVAVLVRLARWQSPRVDADDTVGAITEDELLHLTDEAASAGQIETTDAELIERSLTLGDRRVGEILIPIGDVVGIAGSAPVDSALRTAIEAGHRRLLVHDDDLLVTGFVHLRDLAHALTGDDATVVADHARPALTVDGSTLAIDVLREMQRSRCHLAIVTSPDATDAPAGMVTIEDIVEELLGSINESDTIAPRPEQAS